MKPSKRIIVWSLIYFGLLLVVVAFWLIWCAISGNNPIDWLSSKWAMYIYLGVGVLTIAYISLTLKEISDRR